jgi:tetratricopeptide (TPR) repeat protein
MSNPTTQGHQLVRFEEVTPTNEIVAFLAGRLKPLVAGLELPIYDGYDGLDEIQFVFLTLPSGQTVTLGQYANSPQVGVDLYVDNTLQDIPTVTFEACKYLGIPRQEAIWFHPDWQDEIDRLYAEHGSIRQSRRYANEKRPESSQLEELEELTQLQQYEPIDCFNHALRIYTIDYVPTTYWAMLQHNLGLAYQNRSRGDRRENLERSIECFDKSLEIFTQDKFPEKWKISQDDLVESQRLLELYKESLIEDISERLTLSRKLRQSKGVNLSVAMKGLIKIPEHELRILEAFAEKAERNKTDIIREFIRSLQSKI